MARALGLIIRHEGNYRTASVEAGISRHALRKRVQRAQERGLKPRASVSTEMPAKIISPSLPRRQRAPLSNKGKPNQRVLVISDLHAPYQHKDALMFLAALKKKYNFDRVISVGDEQDYHGLSFHDSNPDLNSAGVELQKSQEVLLELEALFPQMDICSSNHGDMPLRRALAHGIPSHLVVEYKDAIFGTRQADGSIVRPNGRGDGWNWHKSILVDLPSGNKCYIVHGRSISTKANVQQVGMNFSQGHHHGSFEIIFNGTPESLNWGMTVGCLIDDDCLAFAYNRNTLKRPIIGCGAIFDSFPKLLPMVLDKNGRWTGFVP